MAEYRVSLLGEEATHADRGNVWQSLAYANYIPTLVGFGSDAKPTPEMWAIAENSLRSLLEALRPNFVFVLGETVWSHLPKENSQLAAMTKNGRRVYRCVYRFATAMK